MTLISNESTKRECVCDHCQFILHCGCRDDDHEYKLDTCDYYALDNRYNLISAQFDKVMARMMREGEK